MIKISQKKSADSSTTEHLQMLRTIGLDRYAYIILYIYSKNTAINTLPSTSNTSFWRCLPFVSFFKRRASPGLRLAQHRVLCNVGRPCRPMPLIAVGETRKTMGVLGEIFCFVLLCVYLVFFVCFGWYSLFFEDHALMF